MSQLTIGKQQQAARLNVETIRYHERCQLKEQPPEPAQGCRRYPKAILARVVFIEYVQELWFTLEEIDNLLALGDSHCPTIRKMIDQ
tara:strand:+ start:132 stop:392 length:261 start_codon:yes stop_codon:yes gene_type:complete